jgi:protein TonB
MSDQTAPASGSPAPVSNGWLGANSSFGTAPQQRRGPAFIASLLLHGLGLVAVLVVMSWAPNAANPEVLPLEKVDLVFVRAAGPVGGGGGGNKMPDPPRKLEMKRAELPKATVLEPVKSDVPPPPPPSLVAAIQTDTAVLQSAGTLAGLSAAPSLGSGVGTGAGPGRGPGVGPGSGGNFGDGAYGPGSGATEPTLLRGVDPKYTTDAMRAKIQGVVKLEVVVEPDGTVKNVRILQSLDRAHGLDLEAIKTAREWRFKPATFQGKPVPFIVIIEMTFNLR